MHFFHSCLSTIPNVDVDAGRVVGGALVKADVNLDADADCV